MSLTFRIILGVAATVCTVMLGLWASTPDNRTVLSFLPVVFCASIALMCVLRGRPFHFLGGVVATGVMAAGLSYLWSTLVGDSPWITGRQSDSTVVNALLFCGFFGWPAFRYLQANRFGFVEPPRPLDERLTIEFDETEVRVIPHDQGLAELACSFAWRQVSRVCFVDRGVDDSDLLIIEVRGDAKPVLIPTEARGGTALFGPLEQRGLFPEAIWRRALAETGGRTHCWPPHDEPRAH